MKIVTHNAKFHSDDVFAVAALSIMLGKENCTIIRTRDPELIAVGDYVVDVGEEYDSERNRFDHHQKGGAEDRPNGIPYASFGLVWKHYGEKICQSTEVADAIEKRLVQPIDAGDNGKETYLLTVPDIYPFTVNSIIDLYRATWKEEGDWDRRFIECVDWAMTVLSREIKVASDIIEGQAIVRDMYKQSEDKRVVIIPEMYDLGRELVSSTLADMPDALYTILYRHDHKNWQLVAVRKEHGSFEMKKPLPEAWRAKHDLDIEKASGVKDVSFCHKRGLMCITNTKEAAVQLAEIALNS